jgi:hypothetical protein
MGGSGGGGNSTTVQKADPWSGVQPYLQGLYKSAGDWAMTGGPQTYTGETYAPLNSTQYGTISRAIGQSYDSGVNGAAVDEANNIGAGNDVASQSYKSAIAGTDTSGQAYNNIIAGNDATSQYLKSALKGDYLNGNPYLTGAMDAANADTVRNFQTAVMPSLASQFSAAGRYGSGAQMQGVSDATNNVAKQISNTNAGIMNANYQNERGIQNGAAGTLGSYLSSAISGLGAQKAGATNGLASLSSSIIPIQQALTQQGYSNNWNNIQNMAGIGDVLQQNQQGIDTARANQFNTEQQRPFQNLSWLNSILNGSMALSGQSSNTQQSSNGGGLKGALGGAGAGAAMGAAVGSVVPGLGTALGAGVGALGGALMGVL